jgi:hypothetical protein
VTLGAEGGTNEGLNFAIKGTGQVNFNLASGQSRAQITNSGGMVLAGNSYAGTSPGAGQFFLADGSHVIKSALYHNGGGTLSVSSSGTIGFTATADAFNGAFDTSLARHNAGILRISNGSTGAGNLLIGAAADTFAATDAQVGVFSQSATRPGLKLSALTGTAASQQVIQSYNAAGATLTYAARADGFEFQNGVTFANLPGTPVNGMYGFCTDCAVTSGADNTCTSGGNGAFAVRLNGVWRCFIAQN